MLPTISVARPDTRMIDQMAISVGIHKNREFAYTDKESGYFYGRTDREGKDYFSGWNVNRERVFKDYKLMVDNHLVDRKIAEVTVAPHFIKRRYIDFQEELRMFDYKKVLSIKLRNLTGKKVAIALLGERIAFSKAEEKEAFYKMAEVPSYTIAVSAIKGGKLNSFKRDGLVFVEISAEQEGFFIALDSSDVSVTKLLESAQKEHEEWTSRREARMEKLLRRNHFETSDPVLDLALRWNILSLDALVTKQTGDGIYAGLPWFNDYWGRDMFISLPGTSLVTGEFDVARKILLSFAQFQNLDESSKYFGRVPNRVRPDEVIYNTTDATPRFVIALLEYIKYSGDSRLVEQLYPVIKRSIDGPLRYWVDEKGYLQHEDADTWMDAKKDGKIPFSPRGNRANDIQALWFEQLRAGIYFATLTKNIDDAKRWENVARKLKENFEKDFLSKEKNIVADRLTAEGKADFSVRPNQLFALDLIQERDNKLRITRRVWEDLVYPWGVASLSYKEKNFHSRHEYPEKYHKDEAYHNGTVWLWNNGIAMQRMVEAGQKEAAYRLFTNMSTQTLNIGAVGCLSELTDALPRKGRSWVKLSGTFSQAWSSAEYLRVWYQSFLGFKPDASSQKKFLIEPNIPAKLTKASSKTVLFDGFLDMDFERVGNRQHYSYSFRDIGAPVWIELRLRGFLPLEVKLSSQQTLKISLNGNLLQVKICSLSGDLLYKQEAQKDSKEAAKIRHEEKIFDRLTFCPVIK